MVDRASKWMPNREASIASRASRKKTEIAREFREPELLAQAAEPPERGPHAGALASSMGVSTRGRQDAPSRAADLAGATRSRHPKGAEGAAGTAGRLRARLHRRHASRSARSRAWWGPIERTLTSRASTAPDAPRSPSGT